MRRHAVALLLAAAGAGPAAATEAAVGVPVEQPRAFGHVLGDVLTQRVLLRQGGRNLEPAALPAADRVGRWLERRAPRIESDAEGRRWLALDYQLINAPRVLSAATLPPLSIATTAGPVLAVPAWPLSIGPLTLDDAGAAPLQPDRPVAPRATLALQRQLQATLLALSAVLCAWLAWWAWRGLREAQRLPFASAWRRLRRLDPADPAAWLLLHQALNRSAGRVVHAASLPRLFDDAPQLRALQAELEGFYRASSARFFAGADGAPGFPLHRLARALRAIEKRHQR